MNWNVKYLPEALDDLRKLDGSQKILIRKAIQKVCQNPLPETKGGYGKLLGNKGSNNLSGFLKIKLRTIYKELLQKLSLIHIFYPGLLSAGKGIGFICYSHP